MNTELSWAPSIEFYKLESIEGTVYKGGVKFGASKAIPNEDRVRIVTDEAVESMIQHNIVEGLCAQVYGPQRTQLHVIFTQTNELMTMLKGMGPHMKHIQEKVAAIGEEMIQLGESMQL